MKLEYLKTFENFKLEYRISRPELEIYLVKGRWQDVLETVDVFDSIFFDDYIGLTFVENTARFNKFLYENYPFDNISCISPL